MPRKKGSESECQYHSCLSRDGLKPCKYCEKKFCPLHHDPYSPSLGPRDNTPSNQMSTPAGVIAYRRKTRNFQSALRHSGHPCFVFAKEVSQQEQTRNERYSKALDWILKRKQTITTTDNNIQDNQQDFSGECGYHPCHSEENLNRCEYCRKQFCPAHMAPYSPSIGGRGRPARTDQLSPAGVIDYKMHKDVSWTDNHHEGHPCVVFADYLIQRERERKDSYGRALDMLCRNPRKRPRSSSLGSIAFVLASLFLAAYVFVPSVREFVNDAENKILTANQSLNVYQTTTTSVLRALVTNISTTTTTRLSKPPYNALRLEQQIHDLINRERVRAGLDILKYDDDLVVIARRHSADMGSRNFFAHTSPEGHDLEYRYQKFGYKCEIQVGNLYYGGAENIAQDNLAKLVYSTGVVAEYKTQDEIAKSVVDGWMNSSGHRKNILAEFWINEGIGVYIADDDKVYVTEDFC